MYDLNTMRRLNGEKTAPKYTSAISDTSRVLHGKGVNHLQVFRNGRWETLQSVRVPSPLPAGVTVTF